MERFIDEQIMVLILPSFHSDAEVPHNSVPRTTTLVACGPLLLWILRPRWSLTFSRGLSMTSGHTVKLKAELQPPMLTYVRQNGKH